MPIENEPYTLNERGWTVRIASPGPELVQPAPRSLLLLHGRTGDENVMWIFTHNLPHNPWIFSPRAPVTSAEGGYAWLPPGEGWPRLANFEEVAGKLLAEFHYWANGAGAPTDQVDVMGFSQGAAMAYALAALYPRQIQRVIALAGFLPAEDNAPGRYTALQGKKVYVAHGSKDLIVPVQKALEAVRTLEAAGADIAYCESDVGHKLSAPCLRGLKEFLTG